MAHSTPPNPRARQYQPDGARSRAYARDLAAYNTQSEAEHKRTENLKGGRTAKVGARTKKSDVGKMKPGKTTMDVAKEVGRSGKRAGKSGVEVAKSSLKSVHELSMAELFPKS